MITQKFVDKVRGMKASEIIETMITGLENPVTVVNMRTYGSILDGVCYGCAATNTIAKLCSFGKVKIKKAVQSDGYTQGLKTYTENRTVNKFVDNFESAIDYLRMGDIDSYNFLAKKEGIAEIKVRLDLPFLTTTYYKNRLHSYKELADLQKEWENNNL